MTKISLFALLGLMAIGASNLSFIPPIIFMLIWLIASTSIRKEWEFRPSPNLEAIITIAGFLLAAFLATMQDIHLFVRLGNGLAVIQLLRMFRNLNNREKIASVVISFAQVAISTQVVLGFGFILILLSFIYLFPAALRELNVHPTMSLRAIWDNCSRKARFALLGQRNTCFAQDTSFSVLGAHEFQPIMCDKKIGHYLYNDTKSSKIYEFLTLAAVSCLFFLFFPRIHISQQHYPYVSFPSTASLPSSAILSDSSSSNKDSLIMLIEGEKLNRVCLHTVDTYKNGRWKRTPKGKKETVSKSSGRACSALENSSNKPTRQTASGTLSALERKVMVIDIRRMGRFLPHDGKIISARGDYFSTLSLTTGDDYRITPTRLSGTGKYTYYIAASHPESTLSPYERRNYLSVPELSPEFTRLVSGITGGIEKQDEKAHKLGSYLKSSFRYVSKSPKRNMSFGEFLSVEKKGSCLDFAGALTMMLRISGIPARVVAGYLPEAVDEKHSRYKIYQRNAHSWVEAYLDGKGWVSFDPTPYSGKLATLPFLTRARERIQDIWYWKIIGFTPSEQEKILQSLILFIKNAITRNFFLLPGILLALTLVLFLLKHRPYLSEKRLAKHASDENQGQPLSAGGNLLARIKMFMVSCISGKTAITSKTSFYTCMNKLLRQLGHQRLPNETPLEFVRRLRRKDFGKSEEIEFLSWCFCKIRYGGETLSAHTREKIDSSLLHIKELAHTSSNF